MHPIFQPLIYNLRHRFFHHGRPTVRTICLFLFGLFLFISLYLVSLRVVGYFHRQNELGILLSLKIFEMAWMIMFAMLVFSAMVSGVSALFLSNDNEIFCAAPISAEQLYSMRYLTTMFYTSWMMIIFSLPVFSGFGSIFEAGALYLPLLLVATVSTAATATGIGLCAIIVLVTLFPARRTKDIAVYLSLLFSLLLFLVFRLIRPEDLADPDKFPDFMDYLTTLQTPATPLMPSSWPASVLTQYMRDQQVDWLLCGLLTLTPLIIFYLGELLMQRLFFPAFSKAQESFGGYRTFRLKAYSHSPFGWFLRKELKMFIRDSSEWSQLFLIGALMIVYLYNFKALPLDRAPMPVAYLSNLIAYANIGLVGFLIASLSARFVFPCIGAEGQGFTLIRSAPISLARYLLYKYIFYLIPFSIIAITLLLASNHLLHIKGPMLLIAIVTGLVITSTVVALALGFGCIYADFKVENRAAAQGSFGAILFLFTALAYELVIIALCSVPAYRLTRSWITGKTITIPEIVFSLFLLVLLIGSSVAATLWCLRRGIQKLEKEG